MEDLIITIDQKLPPILLKNDKYLINFSFDINTDINTLKDYSIKLEIINGVEIKEFNIKESNEELNEELKQKKIEKNINKSIEPESSTEPESDTIIFVNKNFYKIQLKLENNREEYYSNIGIAQFIDNTEDSQEIIFQENKYFLKHSYTDTNNKINFYKYILKNFNNDIVQESDWIFLNDISFEKEQIIEFNNLILEPYQKYKIIFEAYTESNILIKKEEEIYSKNIFPINFPAKIITKNNYDNGCIDIFLQKNEDIERSTGSTKDKDYFNGNEYHLLRTDDKSNFQNWEYLITFSINNITINDFLYKDNTVQFGVKYKYGIEQVNKNGFTSKIIKTPNFVIADFEDIFLVDAEAKIKIKYNPKISSYKTIKNENKVETIGNQYPYIIRNGKINYKEIPISGLISFQMDDMKEQDNIYLLNFSYSDLIEENFVKEQKYKNYILDWLNNNNYKLLKTPAEGNFIVQVINVSLTPIDSLGRMLHSFQATTYEVDECNCKNLKKYNIITNNKYDLGNKLLIETQQCIIDSDPNNIFDFKKENLNGNIFYTFTIKDFKKGKQIETLSFFNFYGNENKDISIFLNDIETFSNTKSYNIDDLVIYNGDFYKCIRAIEASESNSKDFNSLDWNVIETFLNSESYDIDDLVIYKEKLYKCIQAIEASESNPKDFDSLDWNVIETFLNSESYDIDDLVICDGECYRCIRAITASESDPKDFDLDDWEKIIKIVLYPNKNKELYIQDARFIEKIKIKISNNNKNKKYSFTYSYFDKNKDNTFFDNIKNIEFFNFYLETKQIETFSNIKSYNINDLVIYGGNLYRCIQAIEVSASNPKDFDLNNYWEEIENNKGITLDSKEQIEIDGHNYMMVFHDIIVSNRYNLSDSDDKDKKKIVIKSNSFNENKSIKNINELVRHNTPNSYQINSNTNMEKYEYYLPNFVSMYLTNLENVESLIFGSNLKVDVSYSLYEIK